MKIGFFTDRFYPQVDGVAVSVDLFARELRALGHEVVIFAPEAPHKLRQDPGYVVRFRSFPSIWYEDYRDTMPFTPAAIRKVLEHDLDIIHIHTPAQIGMLGVRIAKSNNIPTVVTHHTDIEQYVEVYKRAMLGILAGVFIAPALMKSSDQYKNILPSLKPKRSLKRWNRQIIRDGVALFYQNCDLVIAPSKKMKQVLQSYGLKKHIHILPTGIDVDEATRGDNFNPRYHFSLPENSPLLLFVGRLGQEKNIQLILRSMPKILDKNPGTNLLIVGDGPYAHDLRDQAKELGIATNVYFTGMLDRPKTFACFRAADVFCFASTTDTQGLVLNEAAIEGKPIVYIDDEISPLLKDGQSAIRAKNNVTSFAAACNKLISHPELANKLGKHAKKLAEHITIQKQAEKLIGLYRSLL